MKFTVKDILNAMPGLKYLIAQPLPAATAFRIKRLVKPFDEALLHYNEEHNRLLEQYGKKIDADRYEIGPEQYDAFFKEEEALLAEEIEVDFSPLKIEDLGSTLISPEHLLKLELLITE